MFLLRLLITFSVIGADLRLNAAAPAPPAAVEVGPWSGAVTPTSSTIKLKLNREGVAARLLLSTQADLSNPTFSHSETSDSNRNRVVTFRLSDLTPNTTYFYVPQIAGRAELQARGRFRTFPESGASFTFAFASCARTASTNRVFTAILENQPLFYINLGDFHYLDITSDSRDAFRWAYDRVLRSPVQAHLYRYVPIVYMWDDHDFGGNNSQRFAATRSAARLTYQEYVPHYPLPAGEGDVSIQHAFTVGRARFIVTDLRSERTPPSDPDDARKSLMGTTQKAWFKRELLAAKGKYPIIFWVSTVPWLGAAGADYYPLPRGYRGYVHHQRLPQSSAENREERAKREDHWSVFATERAEIADYIKANQIRGVCVLHGDAHMLAADDGRNGDFAMGGGAPMPVMCGGPLDQSPSIKGGPYSQGIYLPRDGEGCFGLVQVHDSGDRIIVVYSGRNHQNQEKVALKFEVKI